MRSYYPDPVGVHSHEFAQVRAEYVRNLSRRPHRQRTIQVRRGSYDTTVLKRRSDGPPDGEGRLDVTIGGSECLVGCSHGDSERRLHVARHVRVDQGRTRQACSAGVDDGRGWFVIDEHELSCVLRESAIRGDHDGHRFADSSHLLTGQDRLTI